MGDFIDDEYFTDSEEDESEVEMEVGTPDEDEDMPESPPPEAEDLGIEYENVEELVERLRANDTTGTAIILNLMHDMTNQDLDSIGGAIVANGHFPQPSMQELYVHDPEFVSMHLAAMDWSTLCRGVGVSSLRVFDVTVRLSISVGSSAMGDKAATALAEGLASNRTLKYLSLGNCDIGSEGAIALGRALMTNSTLEYLDLSNSAIHDAGAVGLADCLIKNAAAINTLDLGKCGIGLEGCMAIGNALKTNSTLEALNMQKNLIDAASAIALARGISANRTLTSLAFSFPSIWDPEGHPQIGIEGLAAIGLAIRDSPMDGRFILHGAYLNDVWQELGLTQACENLRNEEIISIWNSNKRAGKRRMAVLLVAFGMCLVPRLGEASPFHKLGNDLFQLVGCAAQSHPISVFRPP